MLWYDKNVIHNIYYRALLKHIKKPFPVGLWETAFFYYGITDDCAFRRVEGEEDRLGLGRGRGEMRGRW